MTLDNRILLINDNEDISRYLIEQLMVYGNYSVSLETTAAAAMESIKSTGFDLAVVKWGMPDMACPQLIKELRVLDNELPIIVLFEENKADLAQQIAELPVCNYFNKPFSGPAITFMVAKGLELRSLLLSNKRLVSILKEQNSGLQKQNLLLSKRIEDSTRNLARLYEDLRSTYLRTIRALAQAIDARDHYTHSHSENVSKYAVAIAREMGYTVKDLEILRDASELHDIGKIGISDLILLKPASLTREEWEEIKKHPQRGAQILEPLTFLSDVIELVRQHHEHFDGTGYPSGKRGEEILLGSRILHVADAYDSMVSARSYRKIPLSKEQAIAELSRNAGTQFDPKVVDAFLRIVNEM
ncbi:MAG: HD domain-containing phosphohydrolase [Deltaproteobacteria bacterium]